MQSAIIGQPHPAYDAGVRSGDRIVRVAGTAVRGKPLREVTGLIQGEENTEVEIVVGRIKNGREEEIPLQVKRATIRVDTVLGAYRNKDTSWNFRLPQNDHIAY